MQRYAEGNISAHVFLYPYHLRHKPSFKTIPKKKNKTLPDPLCSCTISSPFESLELCHRNMKILITQWPFIKSEPSRYWEHLSIAHRTRKGWQLHTVFGQSYTSWSRHSCERDGVRDFHHLGLIFPFSQGHSYSALCSRITELTVPRTPTADDATSLQTYRFPCRV